MASVPFAARGALLATLLVSGCARTIPAPPPPAAPQPETTVTSPGCGDAALTVRTLPPLAAPPGHFWTGGVGPRLVSLGIDGRRVVASTFDVATSRALPVSRGGPRRTRGDALPVVAGEHLLFGDGFSPGPAVYDPGANRWLDVRAGAPDLSGPIRVVTAGERWVVWPAPREAERFAEAALLDLRTGRWTAIGAGGSPSARAYPVVQACADEVFVWGGVAGRTALDAAALSLRTLAWSTVPAEGQPAWRYRAFSGCREREVVIFGGIGLDGKLEPDAARFDLASRTWTRGEAGGLPRFLAEGWTQEPQAFLRGDALVVLARLGSGVHASALDLRTGAWGEARELQHVSAHSLLAVDVGIALLGTCVEAQRTRGPPAEAAAPRVPLRPCAAVLRDGSGFCTWTLPGIPPFDHPADASPFRFGEVFGVGRGVVVRGLTWSLQDPYTCPPGAPCVRSELRFGGSDAAAELLWR